MAKSFQDPSVGASINGWNDPKPGLFAVTKSSSVQSLTNVGITSKLKEIIEKCKEGTVSQPPKHKMVVDCEKRLAELFTKLGDGAVPELLMSHLSELMNALDSKDFTTAGKCIQTMNSQFVDEAKWLLGLKRLVCDIYASL